MSALCAVRTEYPPHILVSMSSRSSAGPADTREWEKKRLDLERHDEMRCGTVSREMKISTSLVGDGMVSLKTLPFSHCLLTLGFCL